MRKPAAIIRPMPREPPVTRAVRPASEKRSSFIEQLRQEGGASRRIGGTAQARLHRLDLGTSVAAAAATCTDAEDRLEQKWPQTLWIVRHGQSAGNVARDAAELGGLAAIDIADRDVDVPLSPLGEQQADALGDWFAAPAARASGRRSF